MNDFEKTLEGKQKEIERLENKVGSMYGTVRGLNKFINKLKNIMKIQKVLTYLLRSGTITVLLGGCMSAIDSLMNKEIKADIFFWTLVVVILKSGLNVADYYNQHKE